MARLLLALIRAYRFMLAPWWGTQCRFTPTCSHYAMDAIASHGAMHGSWLALRRLARCHPWHRGGFDPVP
jgi:putative membrane protein insertion efficiency factor